MEFSQEAIGYFSSLKMSAYPLPNKTTSTGTPNSRLLLVFHPETVVDSVLSFFKSVRTQRTIKLRPSRNLAYCLLQAQTQLNTNAPKIIIRDLKRCRFCPRVRVGKHAFHVIIQKATMLSFPNVVMASSFYSVA